MVYAAYVSIDQVQEDTDPVVIGFVLEGKLLGCVSTHDFQRGLAIIIGTRHRILFI